MKKIFILMCATAALWLCGCGEKTAEEALLKAEIQATAKDWKGAQKYAEKAVSLKPDHTYALLFLAIANEKNGNYDKALDAARHAQTLMPDDFYAQYTLGRLYAKDPSRQTEAYKALLRAYRIKPENTDALILLTNAAMELRSAQAENFLQELQKHADYTPDAVYSNELAVVKFRKNDIPGARKNLVRACSSKEPTIILNMAIFLDRTGSKAVAGKFYALYLKLTRNDSAYAARQEAVKARLRQL